MTRVVITGAGCMTPIGQDVASFGENLFAGRSGIREMMDRPPELHFSRTAHRRGFPPGGMADRQPATDRRPDLGVCHCRDAPGGKPVRPGRRLFRRLHRGHLRLLHRRPHDGRAGVSQALHHRRAHSSAHRATRDGQRRHQPGEYGARLHGPGVYADDRMRLGHARHRARVSPGALRTLHGPRSLALTKRP